MDTSDVLARTGAVGSSSSSRLNLDHVDVELFERLVELVDLRRVQVELVERERNIVLLQEAGLLALADERLGGGGGVQRQACRSIPSPLSHVTPLL